MPSFDGGPGFVSVEASHEHRGAGWAERVCGNFQAPALPEVDQDAAQLPGLPVRGLQSKMDRQGRMGREAGFVAGKGRGPSRDDRDFHRVHGRIERKLGGRRQPELEALRCRRQVHLKLRCTQESGLVIEGEGYLAAGQLDVELGAEVALLVRLQNRPAAPWKDLFRSASVSAVAAHGKRHPHRTPCDSGSGVVQELAFETQFSLGGSSDLRLETCGANDSEGSFGSPCSTSKERNEQDDQGKRTKDAH